MKYSMPRDNEYLILSIVRNVNYSNEIFYYEIKVKKTCLVGNYGLILLLYHRC
jgi:hypothetical protein